MPRPLHIDRVHRSAAHPAGCAVELPMQGGNMRVDGNRESEQRRTDAKQDFQKLLNGANASKRAPVRNSSAKAAPRAALKTTLLPANPRSPALGGSSRDLATTREEAETFQGNRE